MQRLKAHVNPGRGIAVLLISGVLAGIPAVVLWQRDWWIRGLLTFAVCLVGLLLLAELLFPFKCPRCHRKLGGRASLGGGAGERVRFVCPDCQVEWDTGLNVPSRD